MPPARQVTVLVGAQIVGVAVVAGLLAIAQLWVARSLAVLEPAQQYWAGNDFWPPRLSSARPSW